ncbi:hypothetical protein NVIE_1956 [Nitrososphaera viennensis EN76]|uniref:Uncharacterized protein n=1 Tax=Nitrososphaera viennensis EN76 TaxID=926571 RepID=A0A060HSM1_9ARCH|nr:hypothetical protein NVIE_1956 [Nitrososphaera viennensis EN76]
MTIVVVVVITVPKDGRAASTKPTTTAATTTEDSTVGFKNFLLRVRPDINTIFTVSHLKTWVTQLSINPI